MQENTEGKKRWIYELGQDFWTQGSSVPDLSHALPTPKAVRIFNLLNTLTKKVFGCVAPPTKFFLSLSHLWIRLRPGSMKEKQACFNSKRWNL